MIVATKGGHTRPPRRWALDGRPEHLRSACEASLRALGTDRIDLYQYHRPDPKVPYEESIGAIKELQDEGKVRWIGSPTPTSSRSSWRARSPTSWRSRTSSRSSTGTPIGKGEVAECERRGIAFLPWSPLGGIPNAADAAGTHHPVAAAADAHGVSPQQVALAWLLSLGPTRDPDPRREPAGVDPRLDRGGRARAHRRRAGGDRGMKDVVITPYRDGPLLVRGPVRMTDQEGNEIAVDRGTVALCRCGKSRLRPFCDGTHKLVRFKAPSGAEHGR